MLPESQETRERDRSRTILRVLAVLSRALRRFLYLFTPFWYYFEVSKFIYATWEERKKYFSVVFLHFVPSHNFNSLFYGKFAVFSWIIMSVLKMSFKNFSQFYVERLSILAFLPGAGIRRRYDLVKERVLHSSSQGQKRMPKGQSLDGLPLRGWRMDSNSQGWNGSFRRTYPARAVDNHRLMGPGDRWTIEREEEKEKEREIYKRTRGNKRMSERGFISEKRTTESRMKEKVDP